MKLWWIASTLAFAATMSFAQADSLTEEQLKEFNRKALFVDVGGLGSGPWDLPIADVWNARLGFQQISESVFYEIAGYQAQSKQAAQFRNLTLGLLIGGGTGLVGGAVISLVAYLITGSSFDTMDPEYEKKQMWAAIGMGAFGVAIVATIPVVIGSGRIIRKSSSAEMAKSVADEYNKKLVKKIKEE